jgi:uncharacterized protein (DUF983 family)
MNDTNVSRVSVVIHIIVGIVAGYLSFVLANVWLGLGVMIALLLVTGFVTERFVKKKGIKWWMGNGGIIYIFVWVVSWIYFFNLV